MPTAATNSDFWKRPRAKKEQPADESQADHSRGAIKQEQHIPRF